MGPEECSLQGSNPRDLAEFVILTANRIEVTRFTMSIRTQTGIISWAGWSLFNSSEFTLHRDHQLAQ